LPGYVRQGAENRGNHRTSNMNINVSVIGLDQVRKILEGAEKQMKYATMVALTRTAKHTQAMTYDEFRKEFDRPTPTTMRSLFVTPAKKTNMEAKVFMKDREMGGKNIQAMADIIGHHFSGGTRNRKALENLLIRFNFMQRGEFIRPGNAAKLDQYGNISRGQIQQIISQLKIVRSGFDNSPTSSKRSRRNVAKTGKIFWSYGREGTKKPLVDKATGIQYGYTGGAGSKLAKGAWVSDGKTVKPLLIVIKSATYRRRFDLQKIAQSAVDIYFKEEFDRAYQQALATAR
jgi:hypothetical protein